MISAPRPTLLFLTNSFSGTANFGILETRFQEDVVGISQVLWGSIGYSVGALQGAALAVKEQKKERRVILFVGDGSLQLTVQEISTMLRHGLTPIMYDPPCTHNSFRHRFTYTSFTIASS